MTDSGEPKVENRLAEFPSALRPEVRRLAALQLRVQGAEFREIAKQLGYRSVGACFKAVDRALAEHVTPSADAYVELEMRRLDALHRAYWEKAINGDETAASFVLKVHARRCTLLGLDSPRRVDISMLIQEWSERQGLDYEDVVEVAAPLLASLG